MTRGSGPVTLFLLGFAVTSLIPIVRAQSSNRNSLNLSRDFLSISPSLASDSSSPSSSSSPAPSSPDGISSSTSSPTTSSSPAWPSSPRPGNTSDGRTEIPTETIVEESLEGKLEWGELNTVYIGVPTTSSTPMLSPVTEVHWNVPMLSELADNALPLILSPKFYTSHPGHRLQLILIPNSTYSDNSSHLGVFFRLVTGVYDSSLNWPYQYRTEILLHDYSVGEPGVSNPSVSFNVIPNRDPCRLRSAFLRPSTDTDNNPRPDGCGSRRLIDLDSLQLSSASSKYLNNGSITIIARIYLNEVGQSYDTANLTVKYNDLTSEYVWSIRDFARIQRESITTSAVAVLSSEPFYTHASGYLMQMFLTLLPTKNAFAISTAFLQGDFDRSLDWPFPYPIEVAIIDQSPNYWRRDYSVNLDASSADCGSSPFMQPSASVEFCFITVQSMELLTLPHYNFIRDDVLKIRFQSKALHLSHKPTAAISVRDHSLIAEYSWLIPDIENKLERFDYSGRKVKTFTSDKFYTNSQGYLMQIMLQLNHTERANGSLGLELSILEGAHDSILSWPFHHKFDLMIINQRPEDAYSLNPSATGTAAAYPPDSESQSPRDGDIIVQIDPSRSDCDLRSFMKPIERNPSCGKRNVISFARVSRSTGFVRLGSLLVKVRIYLSQL